MKNWFVIQTKPFKEFSVERLFRQGGFPIYLPKIKDDDGSARPLFPRYEFIYFDFPRHFSLVRYTRGVSRVLGNFLGPIPVEEKIIEEIKSREVNGFILLEEDLGEPQPGDLIEVRRGPFQGFRGVFKKALDDKMRVLILLDYVDYQGYLRIEKSKIKKIAAGISVLGRKK